MKMLNRGLWNRFCELVGLNPWCLNEGQCGSEKEFTLTEDQARELGLLEDNTL